MNNDIINKIKQYIRENYPKVNPENDTELFDFILYTGKAVYVELITERRWEQTWMRVKKFGDFYISYVEYHSTGDSNVEYGEYGHSFKDMFSMIREVEPYETTVIRYREKT